MRDAWHVPVPWPLVALVVILVAICAPAVASWRRRERARGRLVET
jgi:hypothetical protein